MRLDVSRESECVQAGTADRHPKPHAVVPLALILRQPEEWTELLRTAGRVVQLAASFDFGPSAAIKQLT